MLLRRLVIGACVAVVLNPGAASAEQWVHRDARSDVVEITIDDEEDMTRTPAPANARVDVLRTVIAHRARELRFSLRLRDVRPGAADVAAELRTPENGRYALLLAGFPFERRGLRLLESRTGDEVRCRGKSVDVDAEADRITLTLPRPCVGDPRWVQARVMTAHQPLAREVPTLQVDDALHDGLRGGQPVWSPRIHRG